MQSVSAHENKRDLNGIRYQKYLVQAHGIQMKIVSTHPTVGVAVV